jgi:hypothetical protein
MLLLEHIIIINIIINIIIIILQDVLIVRRCWLCALRQRTSAMIPKLPNCTEVAAHLATPNTLAT